MQQHIVCLGSSAASLSCAAQIQRLDKNVHVTILTAQSEMPNNTCLLADYVAGNRSKQSMHLPIPDGVDIHYAREIVALDCVGKAVVTQSGHEYRYDTLFIGTGLQARVPDVLIPELYKKVFLFKSLDDIVRFEQQLITGRNVLVIGGGVTGIEAAHALNVRGYHVTLGEKHARLLSKFNQETAQDIHELLQAHGVTIHVNYQITGDTMHEFDAIFLAMGGVPATNFLHDQVLLDNGFIVVNEQQQTTQSDIFAGGDVCVGRTLWPQAVRDGVLAAYGMLNKPALLLKSRDYKTTTHIFGHIFDLKNKGLLVKPTPCIVSFKY